MIRSMEGFTIASALELNMGYYHIKLDADAYADDQKLYAIVYSWNIGKYKCCSMLRGQSQFMTYFGLFLRLDLVCQTRM
jgi:hypothetical protein